MKRILLTLLAGLLITLAGAQTIFEELVDDYADIEGFSAVQLTSDMFELYLKKKNIEADDPVYETLKNLENIMVITQTFVGDEEEDETNPRDGLKYEIIQHYKDNSYNLFKTEKNSGSDLKIYIRKDDGTVESMGLVSSNSFSVNLIEMNGDIDLSNIATLSKALNIRGLEQLRVFNNESPNEFFFNYQYRMPNVDMSEFKMSNERQKEIEKQMQEHQEQFEERHRERMKDGERLQERSRELYKKYQRFPIIISGSDNNDVEYYIDGKQVDLEDIKELNHEKIESIQVNKKDDEKDQIRIKIKQEDEN